MNTISKISIIYKLFPSLIEDELAFLNVFLHQSQKLLNRITVDESFSSIRMEGLNVGKEQNPTYELIEAFEDDATILKRLVNDLQPKSSGAWLELTKSYSDIGFLLNFEGLSVIPAEIETEPKLSERINHWLSKHNSCVIYQISNQIIDQDPFTEVRIATYKDNIEDNLELLESIFKRFDMGSALNKLGDYLRIIGLQKIDLLIGFVRGEVSKIGFGISKPTRDQFLFFGKLKAEFNPDKFILLEDIIENKSADFLSFCLHPDGWKTTYSYSYKNE